MEFQKQIDVLFKYVVRSDARIIAFQVMIPKLLRLNPEHKEAFEQNLQEKYETIHSLMLEEMKEADPEQFLRLYGENPQS